MRPDDFWSATLDECILTYKGKVDEWRFFRKGFNLLHRSSMVEKPANITDVMPLPFDDEINEKGDTENLLEEYNRLKATGVLD